MLLFVEAIAGVDGLDDRERAGTPFRNQVPEYPRLLMETNELGVKGIHIGILNEVLASRLHPKFRAAVNVFTDLGAIVEEISTPMHEFAPAFFGALRRQGGTNGRNGRASARRQVTLTDLHKEDVALYSG